MKTAILIGLVLLATAAVAGANEVYVPSNTPSSGARTLDPFGANANRPDARYQLVIQPKLLGGQPFVIRDIAFAPSGVGSFTAANFEVRMGLTTGPASTLFAANLPSPTTVLSSLNYTWNTTNLTWTPLKLTGMFTYDGTSSLTIEVRYSGGAYARPFTGACMYDTASSDRVFAFGTGVFNAASGTVSLNTGIKVRITVVRAVVIPSGTAKPGTTVRFDLTAASEAGKTYQLGTSLGQGPIPIGPWKVPLAVDSLLLASTGGQLPTVFAAYPGKLDAGGKASANLNLPNLPLLKGVRLYTAFVTLDPNAPSGVSQVSANVPVTIQ